MTSIFLVVDWREGGRVVGAGGEGRGAILAAWGAAALGDLPASQPCSPVPRPRAQRTVRSSSSFWPPTPALLSGCARSPTARTTLGLGSQEESPAVLRAAGGEKL